MENNPETGASNESDITDAFLDALGDTQASHDRVEMTRAAREKLAAEKGVSIEELTPEDLAKTIVHSPFQSRMALDEIFGDGFADFMDGPEGHD